MHPKWPAIFSAILFTSLGCGPSRRAIKVGALVPLTGEVAGFGQSTRMGYELAVQEWNGRGGVLGRPLELAVRDDRGDPAEGLSACSRLIEHDRVVALLGATLSKVSLVGAPVAQAAGVPMVSPSSSDTQLTAVGDCIFRVCSTDRAQGEAGAAFAYHTLKARRAACLFDLGSVYPGELAQVFKTRFTALGGRVVGFASHASGGGNVKPHLATMLRARPDLLYLPDFYPDARLIAQEARAMGFKGFLLGGDGWDSPALLQPGPLTLDHGYFTANFALDEQRPAVTAFIRTYRERNHADPDAFAALGYDAGNVLFDAIRRAGATDGPALRAALASTDLQGVSGRITFDPQRNPTRSPLIIEIKGGRRHCRGPASPQ